jgi:hypothetical protein
MLDGEPPSRIPQFLRQTMGTCLSLTPRIQLSL